MIQFIERGRRTVKYIQLTVTQLRLRDYLAQAGDFIIQ